MTTAATKQRSFAATGANIPTTHHRTANVDGVNIFYREAGHATRPSCCCCTASRPPRTCSATSFRRLPTATA